MVTFRVLNLAEARFECTFARGCEGVCCRNGRPPLFEEDVKRIDDALPAIQGMLTPASRETLNRSGYATRRRKRGAHSARVVDGWCIFFNKGCVLHRLACKPVACALFPIDRDFNDEWFVRQKGYNGEIWDLPCLDPASTRTPAADSLAAELALAAAITTGRRARHHHFRLARLGYGRS